MTLAIQSESQNRFAGANLSRRSGLKAIVWGLVTGVSAAFAISAGRIWLSHNLHTVIPGRVYRSAQLSPDLLERVIGTYGIRTVINLRGCGDPSPWYLE